MEKALTYEQILLQEPDEFLKYIGQFKTIVNCRIDTVEDLANASASLGKLTNIERQLADMQAMAVILKRRLNRESENDKFDELKRLMYEDMIDKEKILAIITKSISEQARSLSKAITAYMEGNKELYMTNGTVYQKRK